MTTPTTQTPELPAAGKLTSDDIRPGPFSEHDLRQQWNAQADQFNQWDSLDSCEQLAWAQARAIAADRAQRHPQVEQMAEALRRLWRWGGFRSGWDAKVAYPLGRWIDSGMVGPLPPLPEYLAGRQGEQSPVDETTTTEPPC